MSEQTLNDAFPNADPGITPFGSYVLVQIRAPKLTTASGIVLSSETTETEKWNTQVGRVVTVGPLAFKNRNTMESWPEGAWCEKGDFVRVAKYGGDRWEVPIDKDTTAMFVIFKDTDLIGKVTSDPLAFRAFLQLTKELDMAQENALIEDDEDDSKDTVFVAVDKPLEDDDDDDDNNLKATDDNEGDNDSDREAIRERRRLEKKERKERRDKAIDRDKIELNFLRNRNDELERRVDAVESHTKKASISDTERMISDASSDVDTAERIIARAVAAGNGEDVTKAMRYRDQAIAKVQQLSQWKQHQSQQVNALQQQPRVDNEVVHHAKEFMEEHSWYDPNGKDEDSAIVQAIDNRLAEEGFDPRSVDYWDELHDRVKRRLPEKFKAARKPTGGPAVGSGREHAPTSTRKEIYISPERKAALQEAGVWDDPVLRQRYTKQYAEYDRANKS